MAVVAKMEVPIQGMDCAECTMHVHKAIAALPGVRSVDVFLTSEKAVVQLDPQLVDLGDIRKAVEGAGYNVPEPEGTPAQPMDSFTRPILRLLGFVFGVVLFVVVVGEWLGVPMFISCFEPGTMRQLVVHAGFELLEAVIEIQVERNVEIPYHWIFARKC